MIGFFFFYFRFKSLLLTLLFFKDLRVNFRRRFSSSRDILMLSNVFYMQFAKTVNSLFFLYFKELLLDQNLKCPQIFFFMSIVLSLGFIHIVKLCLSTESY